jgi:hypothetical protein
MKIPDRTPLDLAAQLRSLGGSTMSGYEADEAARNLTGFVRLLVEIDRTDMQRGDANAGNRGRHRIR